MSQKKNSPREPSYFCGSLCAIRITAGWCAQREQVKDIEQLMLLRRLVGEGNTVVIVEHRLELIAQTDWVIDMGPDGGTSGGEVVCSGTPQDIVACKQSKTGAYLRKYLQAYKKA